MLSIHSESTKAAEIRLVNWRGGIEIIITKITIDVIAFSMILPLFLPAIGFLLFFALLNWRFSAVLGVITSFLAFVFGPTTALTILVGYCILVLFFEPGTAIILGVVILIPSYFVGLETTLLIIFSALSLIFILLVFALSDGQRSIRTGFDDALDSLFAVVLTIFLLS